MRRQGPLPRPPLRVKKCPCSHLGSSSAGKAASPLVRRHLREARGAGLGQRGTERRRRPPGLERWCSVSPHQCACRPSGSMTPLVPGAARDRSARAPGLVASRAARAAPGCAAGAGGCRWKSSCREHSAVWGGFQIFKWLRKCHSLGNSREIAMNKALPAFKN